MGSNFSTDAAVPAGSFAKTVLVTSLAFVVAQLDVSIVNIALPEIADTLKADIHVLQWIVDAYTLVFAVLLLSAGSLADLLGAKMLFQMGMLVFAIASAACGISSSGVALICFRALQGLGSAIMIPSSLAILSQSYAHEPALRTKAVSLWTAAGSVAIAAGPILGGIIVQLTSWRLIFLINVPVCAVGIYLSTDLRKEKDISWSVRFDILGQLLWMISITALIFAVIDWPQLGILHPIIYGALGLSAISFLSFLAVER